jgi:hypothetical protein
MNGMGRTLCSFYVSQVTVVLLFSSPALQRPLALFAVRRTDVSSISRSCWCRCWRFLANVFFLRQATYMLSE